MLTVSTAESCSILGHPAGGVCHRRKLAFMQGDQAATTTSTRTHCRRRTLSTSSKGWLPRLVERYSLQPQTAKLLPPRSGDITKACIINAPCLIRLHS